MVAYKKASAVESREGIKDVQSGPPFLKLEAGKGKRAKKNWIYILPPREDHPNDRWYLWQKLHFSVGPNNRTVMCLQQYDAFCPICAEVDRLKREGYEEESKEMRAKWRALVNVVLLNEKNEIVDDEIKVWTTGRDLIDAITDFTNDLPEDLADISDPFTGRAAFIERVGTGQRDTRYTAGIDEGDDPAPFRDCFKSDEDMDEFLEKLYDLTAVYERIEPAKLTGLLTDGGTPWEEEKPAIPERSSRSRRDDGPPDDEEIAEGQYEEVSERGNGRSAPSGNASARSSRTSSSSSGSRSRETEASAPSRSGSSRGSSRSSSSRETEEPADEAPPARGPNRAARRGSSGGGNDQEAAKARLIENFAADDDDDDEDDEDEDDDD